MSHSRDGKPWSLEAGCVGSVVGEQPESWGGRGAPCKVHCEARTPVPAEEFMLPLFHGQRKPPIKESHFYKNTAYGVA